jgi:hypothetical protein
MPAGVVWKPKTAARRQKREMRSKEMKNEADVSLLFVNTSSTKAY